MVGTTSWINVDKSSGVAGTHTINVTVDATTGRMTRTKIIEIIGSTDTDTFSQKVTVKQTGYPLFLNLDNNEINISNDVTSVEITGTSNSPKLAISSITDGVETPDGIQVFVDDIDVTQVLQDTGSIPSDPGNTAQYNFKFVVPIPTNPDTTKLRTICFQIDAVDGDNSVQKTVNINQGKDYYINVTPTSLTFTSDGGTKSVSIETNTSWSIS